MTTAKSGTTRPPGRPSIVNSLKSNQITNLSIYVIFHIKTTIGSTGTNSTKKESRKKRIEAWERYAKTTIGKVDRRHSKIQMIISFGTITEESENKKKQRKITRKRNLIQSSTDSAPRLQAYHKRFKIDYWLHLGKQLDIQKCPWIWSEGTKTTPNDTSKEESLRYYSSKPKTTKT